MLDSNPATVTLNTSGAPDVDGFLVNTGASNQSGVQDQPVVADQTGQFFGVLWRSTSSVSQTTIRGKFYDVVGNSDPFLVNSIDISDSVGLNEKPQLISGGTNSGYAAAWEHRDASGDTTAELHARFIGPGFLVGPEFVVSGAGDAGRDSRATINQHDVSLSSSVLNRTVTQDPTATTPVDPKIISDGFNAAWTSTGLDASGAATDVAGIAAYGRVMYQRFEVPQDANGDSTAPKAAGLDGLATKGSDASVWVRDEAATGSGGAIGRNPVTVGLHGSETAVLWIEQVKDPAGVVTGERIAGQAYDDLGQVIAVPALANISGNFGVAAGTNVQIASSNGVNFGVAWVTRNADASFSVMGTLLTPTTGKGLNGAGFGFLAPATPFELQDLPAGTNPANVAMHLSGTSGEDSPDLIVTWQGTGADAGKVFARHIAVTLDPATGVVTDMSGQGDAGGTLVNAATTGQDDQIGVAGLLSDRFVTVYHNISGDAGDIAAQIMDVRQPGAAITGDLVAPNGTIRARADVLVGTVGDDTILGDRQDNNGRADTIYGGRGNDTIQGGPDKDTIDGGEGTDTAVYTGKRADYSVSQNADGSVTVIDSRPLRSATDALQNDGTDVLKGIEKLHFLGDNFTLDLGFQPPPPPAPTPTDRTGTPTPWSIDDTNLASTKGQVAVSGTGDQVSVTGMETDAAVAWRSGGSHVFVERYDIEGHLDPLFQPTGAPVELTASGAAAVNNPLVTMAGGVGILGVWESGATAASSIHLRYASMGTNTVFDAAGGIPGAGLAGGEVTVVGSNTGNAVEESAKGYEVVDSANDTLEFGFHVAYVLDPDAAGHGAIKLARYEIPVKNVDAAGNLGTNANGAALNKGAETQPISIGADGLRGTADDAAPIILQTAGAAITGRDPSTASLHDGQLVLTWIDASEHVQLKILVPTTNQAGDRDTGADVATGITTFAQIAAPANSFGTVAAGTRQEVVAQQNGSFVVAWAVPGDAAGTTIAVEAQVFRTTGLNTWAPGAVKTLVAGLAPNTAFHLSSTGVTPDTAALEKGFLLTYATGDGHVKEQNFDLGLAPVGVTDVIDNGNHTGYSAAAIDDGRILLGYAGGGVTSQYLDTRQPGVTIIGPRDGANRDVAVGTVGDDAMDGRAREDTLSGGLGNDLITGGVGADILDGGPGNDTLVGGPDQDIVIGGTGDDLILLSGVGGVGAPKLNKVLPANLQNVDVISGGDGTDTVSVAGESGLFKIDLQAGLVSVDRSDGRGFVVVAADGAIVETAPDVTVFQARTDIENAVGSDGADQLLGNAGANLLTGGKGNDTINGGAGNDVAIFSGTKAQYTVTPVTGANGAVSLTVTDSVAGRDGTDTLTNVELLRFTDGDLSPTTLPPPPPPGGGAKNDAVTTNEDTAVTFDVLANDVSTGSGTLKVTAIDTKPIAAGQPAVTVSHGKVTLGADGKLTFTPDANYNGPAVFAYTVTDSLRGPANANVTVTVNPVNDAPTAISFGAAPPFVRENAVNGTLVATAVATDPDGDTFTYSLVDNAEGRFAIDATGKITVAAGELINPESGASHTLQVQATDSGGLSLTAPVTVAVTNVAETVRVGTAGADTLNGTAGDDIIDGLAGRDTMTGGAGNDTYVVDDSGDKITEAAAQGTDTVLVKLTSFTLGSNVENMVFIGTGGAVSATNGAITFGAGAINAKGNTANNTLSGLAGADQLDGDKGDDLLVGNAGNDTLTGNDGNDSLFGGTGNDALSGGTGNDLLDGGAGNDTLTGGTGNDVFVFRAGAGSDSIADFGFAAGNDDVIQLAKSFAASFTDLASHTTAAGRNTVLTFGSDVLTLTNVAPTALSASDFRFG